MTETLLDRIEAAVRQALTYNENAEAAPVALLWPDRDSQLKEAAAQLRDRLPLLTLGEFDPRNAQGPAYWLRCAIARTVDPILVEGTPIVYMSGVGRDDLRAIEECPPDLAPIAELQYRGQWFAHPNGKDWTVRALLSNRERGLSLDVADDRATREALQDAFGQLLTRSMQWLTSRSIDADLLQQLLNPDFVGSLLEWLNDPRGFHDRLDVGRWKAFVARSKRDYGFDPASQGELIGGRLLGEGEGSWAEVWKRFAQTPEQYPAIEDRLRKGKPTDRLFSGLTGAWPQDNDTAEDNLRTALSDLAGVAPSQVRNAISKLWGQHRDRRNWVWAKLDRTPLVFALEQLQRLARATEGGPTGDVDALVTAYATEGWAADDAFLAALQAVDDEEDRDAVVAAGLALYRPWLEAHTRALQEAIGPRANAGTYAAGREAATDNATVTVFVDGLRLDVAHRLVERLGSLDVRMETALAALPTVTETAKPVLTPVPPSSLGPGQGLGPARTTSGAKATVSVLRSLMVERGMQVLLGADTGDPSASAWTEAGDIDGRGHQFQAAFVDEIDDELARIAKRVKLLLDAGWEQVDIVTDHGWLLLPGGLEKVQLPPATVELKKGRCARLKEGADVAVPTVPWYWDSDVRIGLAPGASCFEANQEYEHGGVSLQECVVPRLRVRAAAAPVVTGGATITKVKWLGLLCRVEFENVAPGATVDIRGRPADAATSVTTEARQTTGGGKASLFVEDEDLEGEEAYIVIVGRDGHVLAQRDAVIGVNR